MLVQITKDGSKNFSILVKGIATKDFERTPILDLSKLMPPREGWKGIRLDSAVWAIQEKAGLTLWWGAEDGESDLALPMESRNAMRFDEGLMSPRVIEGWKKILYLSSFHVVDEPKKFMVILDFDKQ